MSKPEEGIAKNIKAVEWLTAQLASVLGSLLQALWKGASQEIEESLSALIVHSFLLAKRLGIGFGKLEQSVRDKTELLLKEGHPLEEWYGDLSALKTYLEIKR